MKKQTFFPKHIESEDISLISTMGLKDSVSGYRHHPEWGNYRQGNDWGWSQVCRHDTFSLVASESYQSRVTDIAYTKWEDYIKVSLWLSGKHTTVLSGFGQHEHDRPEVFITSGPPEMLKVDIANSGTQIAAVSFCLRRDFFPVHMGLDPDELPEPLRTMALPKESPYGFCRLHLASDLMAATRAILAAPPDVRRQVVYGQAKAVEIMCLLISQMTVEGQKARRAPEKLYYRESRLQDAKELLNRRYTETLTLNQISREVGLNRMALTSGFRQAFGMSVHDCLEKIRMERAHELLQDDSITITQIAAAVGYSHSCTFSTAFRAYFGCPPQKARNARRR